MTDIALGPLACSAPKFDWRTLNSCVNSVFGLTEVAQLQPGSAPGDPSTVMSREAVRVPFAVKLPIALWLFPPPPWYSPLPLIPMTSPVKPGRFETPCVEGVRPGRMRSSSAALLLTMGMFSICEATRVALFSPESSGTIGVSAVTDTASVNPPTAILIVRSERLSPPRRLTPFISVFRKPCSSKATV